MKIKKILHLLSACILLGLTAFSALCLGNKLVFADDFYYTSNVEHLFTHCLIAYPSIAFDKNNSMAKHYAKDCITALEFSKILSQLHQNNYALVNINECFKVDENGIAVKKQIKMPMGKKPLIFSFDDVNYDHKKQGKGMVDKIVLDKSDNLASSTIINGKKHISQNNEFIPILEQFVKAHPDFSVNGAKGTINLTGYDGILGYRTCHTNTQNRDSEINEAKKVIKKLKENGWTFASHSYGHYHMNKISDEKFENEIKLWKEEVESLVGKTQVYVYPYGEWQVFEDGELSQKHKALQKAGFNLFCGVGMQTYFSHLPSTKHKVLFMDRKCVDGSTLKANRAEFQGFFNPLNILDTARNILP